MDYNKLWKTLKEMRIPDHLACLLRNLYVGQEAKGEKVEAVTSFLLLGSKSTVEVDCSHKIKKLLGRRAVTHLDSILNLPIKVCIIRATVFPVVMYGCESWTIKKAECRKIDAFGLWCWRRLLESLGLQEDPTSPS